MSLERGAGAAADPEARPAFAIRSATRDDAPALRELLDAIVVRGGTTAIERTPGVVELADWFIDGEGCVTCFVAESLDDGRPLGFQALGTHDALPPGCADIATFVRVGHAGRGIGKALFEHTVRRARELELDALNATIRADNEGGLAFYSGLGFVEHGVDPGVPLGDGTPVDRLSKRYSL